MIFYCIFCDFISFSDNGFGWVYGKGHPLVGCGLHGNLTRHIRAKIMNITHLIQFIHIILKVKRIYKVIGKKENEKKFIFLCRIKKNWLGKSFLWRKGFFLHAHNIYSKRDYTVTPHLQIVE